MTRLITDEQILKIYQTLQDITGLIECNCGYILHHGEKVSGCEGNCTYSMAVAGMAVLDALPVAAQEAVAVGTRLSLRQDGRDGEVEIPAGTVGTVRDVYATGGVYIEFKGLDAAWNDIEPHEVTRLFTVLPQEAATGAQEPQEAAAEAQEASDTCDRCGAAGEVGLMDSRGTEMVCAECYAKPQEAAQEMTVAQVLDKTDWKLLAEQKQLLVGLVWKDQVYVTHPLEGLLSWMDALQDAAEAEGYPVVFLTEDSQEDK